MTSQIAIFGPETGAISQSVLIALLTILGMLGIVAAVAAA